VRPGRILKRQGVAPLVCCDPVTGEVIRAHRATAIRYKRDRPSELVHIDIKKLRRIPDGGGWLALGRAATEKQRKKKTRIGFDYVHALVDDHTRLAYAEVLPDEKGATAAAFLIRASRYFAAHGIKHIERVLSDNAIVLRTPMLGTDESGHRSAFGTAQPRPRKISGHLHTV
jgi:hypothetical protein